MDSLRDSFQELTKTTFLWIPSSWWSGCVNVFQVSLQFDNVRLNLCWNIGTRETPTSWKHFQTSLVHQRTKNKRSVTQLIHHWKVKWNLNMEDWKMMFLFNWMILRFRVNFPGCISTHHTVQTSTSFWITTVPCSQSKIYRHSLSPGSDMGFVIQWVHNKLLPFGLVINRNASETTWN